MEQNRTSSEGGDGQSPSAIVKIENQEDLEDLSDRLGRLPGPEYISTRPGAGGKKIHYLTGESSSALANEVFGHTGWSSSISSITVNENDVSTTTIRVSVQAVVKVTCLYPNKYGQFASHEDVGTGFHSQSIKNVNDISRQRHDALDAATKSAATDGRKRALKPFGNAVGLFLTDPDAVRAVMRQKAEVPVYNMHRKSQSVSRNGTPGMFNTSTVDGIKPPQYKRRATESKRTQSGTEENAELAKLMENCDWEQDMMGFD